MHYHHVTYVVRGNETLAGIAASMGYENPGPIVAYPPNRANFQSSPVIQLRAGTTVFIPWHPDVLQNYIGYLQSLVDRMQQVLAEQTSNKNELDRFIQLIDIADFALRLVASLCLGIVALIREGAKDIGVKEVLFDQLRKMRDVSSLAIDGPVLHQKDWKFYARHLINIIPLGKELPLGASYVSSAGAAWITKDSDVFVYGPQAVVNNNVEQTRQQVNNAIGKLQERLKDARLQASMSFYQHKLSA